MRADAGFALVALMVVLGAGAFGFALVVGELASNPTVERARSTRARLERVLAAVEAASALDGTAPPDLGAIAGTFLDAEGDWRVDPFGAGSPLVYVSTAAEVTVTSRGPDGVLGSADDFSTRLDPRHAARARTRDRLRVLRAMFLRSPWMDTALMAPEDRVALREHVRTWAISQRGMLHADPATRASLAAQRDVAAAAIMVLRAAYLLPDPIPANATGPGGLLESLGLPDSLGVDGFGNPLSTGIVGFVSHGPDRVGGTDDDL